jgi:cell division protein FtsB
MQNDLVQAPGTSEEPEIIKQYWRDLAKQKRRERFAVRFTFWFTGAIVLWCGYVLVRIIQEMGK